MTHFQQGLPSPSWIAVADGLIDRNGKPRGTDFSIWLRRGLPDLAGPACRSLEPARQHTAEKAEFGDRAVPFDGWHYPTLFLAVPVPAATLGWL
jgi:alpha-1,2-mannosyltransferase